MPEALCVYSKILMLDRIKKLLYSSAFVVVFSTLFFTNAYSAHSQETCESNNYISRLSESAEGVAGNSPSASPKISADGNFVLFISTADNLVPGDTNNANDLFVKEVNSGNIERVSVTTSGQEVSDGVSSDNGYYSISENGRFVAFQSPSSDLVLDDDNNATDIFVHDRLLHTTELVSKTQGVQADKLSRNPSISADGNLIAYESLATNLDVGDTNGKMDIFVFNRDTGVSERVSFELDGSQLNDDQVFPNISANGRYVAYVSGFNSIYSQDIYVYDRVLGSTKIASLGNDGKESNKPAENPSISGDGRYVVFDSLASNLIDESTGHPQLYMHDFENDSTILVSRGNDGLPVNGYAINGSITSDGRYVVFYGEGSNLDPDFGMSYGTHLYQVQTGEIAAISVNLDGTINSHDLIASAADNGRRVVFGSSSDNIVCFDTDNSPDVFLYDANLIPGTQLQDTDGDSLPDEWEENGYTYLDESGVEKFYNLNELGADPFKRDIFIEADWLVLDGQDADALKPKAEAIQIIVNSFADAPADCVNSNCTPGINLHVDAGPDSINYPTGQVWGEKSRSNQISAGQEYEVIGSSVDSGIFRQEFVELISDNFPNERQKAFRYSLFANRYELPDISGCSSGVAPPAVDGGLNQVFLVSLGFGGCSWGGGTVSQQSGTFMHELGHTLGLNHGGDQTGLDEDGNEIYNHKPNYLSVMNYSFQTDGLITGDQAQRFDYSGSVLPTLNEDDLNELIGLNGGEQINGFGTKFRSSLPYVCLLFPDTDAHFYMSVYNANGEINWDCDFFTEESASANINGQGGGGQILEGYNDWDHLTYKAGIIGAGQGENLLELDTENLQQELTYEQDLQIQRVNEPRLEVVYQAGPETEMGAEVTHTIFLTNNDAGSAHGIKASVTLPEGFIYKPGSVDGDLIADPATHANLLTWENLNVSPGDTIWFSFISFAPEIPGVYTSILDVESSNSIVLPETTNVEITVLGPTKIDLEIDIKPGSDENTVNLKSKGVLPVAILGSENFDVQEIDPNTLVLSGASVAQKGNNKLMISHEDINGDGFVDLLAHFDIENLEADNTTTELVLTGNTFSGTEIQGTDSVRIVPKAKNSILQNWLTKKEKIVEIVRNIFKYYLSHFR